MLLKILCSILINVMKSTMKLPLRMALYTNNYGSMQMLDSILMRKFNPSYLPNLVLVCSKILSLLRTDSDIWVITVYIFLLLLVLATNGIDMDSSLSSVYSRYYTIVKDCTKKLITLSFYV